MRHVFHKFKVAQLKRRLERNPFLGEKKSDGTYIYKKGGYRLRYRIIGQPQTKDVKNIEWIEIGRRSDRIDEVSKSLEKFQTKFWRYQGWLNLFRFPTILILIAGVMLFYFGLIEPMKAKIDRYRWVIAKVVGIRPEEVEYIGDGWIEMGMKRTTAVDRQSEPVRYRVNPFRWLFTNDAGYVDRWRGDNIYTTHRIVFNETGDVWLKMEETWKHGVVSGDKIAWDERLGRAHRAGKILGEEISTGEGGLSIRDR